MHKLGVDVLVAPYEADAQLAFLSKANIAQVIITEDSDLIPFGCEKVIIFNKKKQLSIQLNKIIFRFYIKWTLTETANYMRERNFYLPPNLVILKDFVGMLYLVLYLLFIYYSCKLKLNKSIVFEISMI